MHYRRRQTRGCSYGTRLFRRLALRGRCRSTTTPRHRCSPSRRTNSFSMVPEKPVIFLPSPLTVFGVIYLDISVVVAHVTGRSHPISPFGGTVLHSQKSNMSTYQFLKSVLISRHLKWMNLVSKQNSLYISLDLPLLNRTGPRIWSHPSI